MKFASTMLSFLAAAAVAPVVAMKQAPPAELIKRNLMIQGELPHVEGEDWTTLENGMEFMPAADLSPLGQVHLRRLTDGVYSGTGFDKVFLDGAETYYDGALKWLLTLALPKMGCLLIISSLCLLLNIEYAQAWRALGFYIDCNYEGDGGGDGDNGGDDCKRLLLWAAVSSFLLFFCKVFSNWVSQRADSMDSLCDSTLMRTTKEMVLANTNTMIARRVFGTIALADTRAVRDVSRWTATFRTPTTRSLDSSRSLATTNGWSSSSSMKEIVSGLMKNTSSCNPIVKSGHKDVRRRVSLTKLATSSTMILNPRDMENSI